MHKTLTIKDIAKIAGVSTATVSRVLNERPGVKKETRREVLKIIKKYNYTPSIFARALVKKQMKNIGLIFPYNKDMLLDLYLTELTGLIKAEITKIKYDFTLYFPGDYNEENLYNEYVNFFNSRQILGLLIGGVKLKDESILRLARTSFPFVLIGATVSKLKKNSVDINHRKAVKYAINRIIKKGIRKISYIGGTFLFSSSVEKFKGYEEALKENNILLDKRIIFHGAGDYNQACSIVKKLASEKIFPDAFFCENDMLAWGVLNALHQLKIKIPENVSVIGYNDIKIAKFFYPPLSTISIPKEKLASRAVKMLLKIIETGESQPNILLEAEFVKRESSV